MKESNSPKERRTSGRHSKSSSKLKEMILKITGLVILAVLILGIILFVKKAVIPMASMYTSAMDNVNKSTRKTFQAEQSSIIYDADGNEIKKLKGTKDITYLSYKDIPDSAKLAIIAVEDKNFTTHRGIDVQGILRSVVSLVKNHGEITMGGSTITQQLARNIFLNYDQTYTRKIEEIFTAMALEQKYSKQEILEFYLNNVYFSNGYYGIQSASQAYFGKDAKDLTIAQSAFLCAIPNSPGLYDPYKNPRNTLRRRNKILEKMYQQKYISKSQYEKSFQEDVTIQKKKETNTNNYVETYILRCATEALMRKKGFTFQTNFTSTAAKKKYQNRYNQVYQDCNESLYTGGYRIYTSIDMEKQNELQQAIAKNLSEFTAKTDDGVYKVQGAAVSIDNNSGRVVAIVGGREEDQEGYGLNRAYQSFRQPGSAIKPLLVYAPALESGYTPDSTLDDSRMTGKNIVRNSDGYAGSVSLRYAVAKSSNVATYRLYQKLGAKKCLRYLEKLNFIGLTKTDYKYDTTSIGGFTKGATVLEMAAGYATLENDGKYRYPTCITKIADSDGKIVVENEDDMDTQRIYTTKAAREMTSVLESVVTSAEGTARNCSLNVSGIPVACKTGTTSNYVDGWLCGYSPYYTTAVWVGMDTSTPVDNLKGNTYPAYIWKDYMDQIHQNKSPKDFETAYDEEDSEDDTEKSTTEDKRDIEDESDKSDGDSSRYDFFDDEEDSDESDEDFDDRDSDDGDSDDEESYYDFDGDSGQESEDEDENSDEDEDRYDFSDEEE